MSTSTQQMQANLTLDQAIGDAERIASAARRIKTLVGNCTDQGNLAEFIHDLEQVEVSHQEIQAALDFIEAIIARA